MRAGIVVNVTRADRDRLEAIVSDRSAPQKHVWRANIILATAEGCGTAEIMRRSGKSKPVVWRWQARFMAEGIEGLTRDKTRKPGKPSLPPNTVQRVVDLALGPPPGESTHWTGRELAKAAGVSLRSVQRILEAHQLAPHRIRTFKLSKDPEFVEKLRDIVGLYVDPPAHANPGARPHPARSADEEGPRWDDDPRLQTPWHNDAVCRPQCARRHRHRPQHAAPPAPGVHPLPQHRRGAGAGANGDPRRRRQLRDPQTSQGTKMAGPASPLDVSLHAYLGVLAQRRRRLLRQTHETAPQAWSVPVGCRPSGCNQPVRRRNQLRSQTLRLDR